MTKLFWPYTFAIFALGMFSCWMIVRSPGCYAGGGPDQIDTMYVFQQPINNIHSIRDSALAYPVTVYKPVEYIPQWIFDSLSRPERLHIERIYIKDSTHVAVRQYNDSVRTENYFMKYRAEVLGGYLTALNHDVTIFKDSIVHEKVKNIRKVPNFSIITGAGVQLDGRIFYSGGASYKNWIVEAEMNGRRLHQLNLKRQFFIGR